MKELIFLIGISGSGKSTYINKNFLKKHVVSPDLLRKRLTGDVSDHSRENVIWNLVDKLLNKKLTMYGRAVLDATNVDSELRQNLLNKFESNDIKKIAVIFSVDPNIAKNRIKKDIEMGKDRSKVPDDIVDIQYKKFKDGFNDIKLQFDDIIYADSNRIENVISDEIDRIIEGFEVSDKVYFDPKKSNDIINTLMGKGNFQPRITKLGNTNIIVYSAYSKNNKKENVEAIRLILNALKGKSDIEIDKTTYEKFINRTAIYFYHLLKNQAIDAVVTIESSAGISDDIKNELLKRLPYKPIVFDEGIKKNINFAEYWIDKENVSQSTLISLEKIVQKQKEGGYFKIQKIPAQFRKFIRNWLKIDDELREKIPGKTILIIDDFLTSGSTLLETAKLINELKPAKIIAITILK